ncbi:hypothetical protein V496_04337 [Pseudogymnoascus sp. VKM F-4515 (FW-2607)]|nr:hypothetical protein V496_04337 [Pseudogymnoascus sp. VKM F-4515 (FW-2607)]
MRFAASQIYKVGRSGADYPNYSPSLRCITALGHIRLMTSVHTARLAALACRPPKPGDACEIASFKPCPDYQHSEAEWEAVYPHILQLYIHQRRKLRYVMRHMEETYNFHATPQMYKNRFTKWGLYKNMRRARAVSNAYQISDAMKGTLLPLTPETARLDAVNLILLTSIRTWSSSFFEAVGQSHNTPAEGSTQMSLLLPYTQHTEPYDAEQTSFSFKLIAELLGRDQGLLAGRLARKAFLQVEEILMLEGPVFIWNLLEILHCIAQSRQAQLFEIILIHLLRLARSHYSDQHSIVRMLHSLWSLYRTYPDGGMQKLLEVLEQGWLLNAEIVLSNENERLLPLYYRLIWDSVLIKLARNKLRDTDSWFLRVISKVPVGAMEGGVGHIYASVEATPDTSGDLPADYEVLKTESINAIHRRSRWDYLEPSSRFRVLSALIKSRIIDDREVIQDGLSNEGTDETGNGRRSAVSNVQGKVPRLHARILAYVMKVLMEIDIDQEVNNGVIIERLNNTIALREYGQGVADPQVICEKWQLQQLLEQEDRLEEAAQIGQDVQRRLDQYLRDIP